MNYEQKYKDALERAKKLYDNANGMILKKWVEQVFPELKESEDERIKKEIIQFLQLPHPQFVGKRNHEEWIAWLEKQGKIIDEFQRSNRCKNENDMQNSVTCQRWLKSLKERMKGE